jgi:hypothetical protein
MLGPKRAGRFKAPGHVSGAAFCRPPVYVECLRMAQGGAKAETEVQRMITEKVAALAESQEAATVATLKGSKKHRVAKKALGVYAGRVRRRRLSK